MIFALDAASYWLYREPMVPDHLWYPTMNICIPELYRGSKNLDIGLGNISGVFWKSLDPSHHVTNPFVVRNIADRFRSYAWEHAHIEILSVETCQPSCLDLW